MKLVVTEKNIAAQKIADLLGIKKPKADKVYNTPVYRFELDGEEWVTIGLRLVLYGGFARKSGISAGTTSPSAVTPCQPFVFL